MLRAKRERSPNPMLLTLRLSGWHKDVAKHFLMPTPRWVSKGPRSFQLRGPFALPGYITSFRSLRMKAGLERMIDGFLT